MLGDDTDRVDIGARTVHAQAVGSRRKYLTACGVCGGLGETLRDRYFPDELLDERCYPTEHNFSANGASVTEWHRGHGLRGESAMQELPIG